jgi:hypothetical protein
MKTRLYTLEDCRADLLTCYILVILLAQAGEEPYPYPSVHAPWYGYLFWTIATAGGYGKAVDTTFVGANVERWDKCAANIKVGWLLVWLC